VASAETIDVAELDDAGLLAIEEQALELVRLAGAEIQSALGRTLAVRYKKSAEGAPAFRDPVSEVDQAVETLIRARLAERFPDHEILGEEVEEEVAGAHDVLWAIDPIDGTANFVNGFPLFAASIGVLHRDRPVAGALWVLDQPRARRRLSRPRRRPAALRGQAADARRSGRGAPPSRRRAGGGRRRGALGRASHRLRGDRMRFRRGRPAAGRALRTAAYLGRRGRRRARPRERRAFARARMPGWVPLERFDLQGSYRSWRQPLVLGEAAAVEIVCQRHG
jgi:myo-inositol-1(or 4)-monophosphatase